MESFQSISETIYAFAEWTWQNGGWWLVIGSISCILLIGMKLPSAHQRKG